MQAPTVWKDLGLCAYETALMTQEACWRTRRRDPADVCLVLEHPPTITLGRAASSADIRVPADVLGSLGIACIRTERGGGVTYHGPGQLVLYPIVDLRARRLGVARYVYLLEELLITIAAGLGVRACRDGRGPGIWTERGKLGAVGIRVRRGITTHGVALNVDVDLDGFQLIVPCGMPDAPVTSIAAMGRPRASVAAARQIATHAWRAIFDRAHPQEPVVVAVAP